MAPRNNNTPRARGGHRTERGGTERRIHKAYTGAGAHTNRSNAGRDDRRFRDTNRRYYPHRRARDRSGPTRNALLSGPRADLTTNGEYFHLNQGDASRDSAAKPHPQHGRFGRLLGSLGHDEDGGGASSNPQVGTHDQGVAVRLAFGGGDDDMNAETDTRATNMSDHAEVDSTEQPAHFNSRQLTDGCTPSTHTPSAPSASSTLRAAASPATTPCQIRELNAPTFGVGRSLLDSIKPKRPVNTYRGKDPIKRLVSNKKLQAIFAGRGFPKERKKYSGERPDLRMGTSRVTK